MSKVTAIISVLGQDQKGVVARFATHLAEHGINIEDIKQQVVRGLFVMDMLVDLTDMTLSLDELITNLLETGKQIGMEVKISLKTQPREKHVAVLVSKEPHCLERLIEDHQHDRFNGKIVCVLSNHEVLREQAEQAGLTFEFMPSTDKPAHMAWLIERMKYYKTDLVLLARYMQILTTEVVQQFPYKVINIHPSLLPHFPGSAPYRQAFDQGVRVSGCTAHFVTEQLDEGPIILQDVFHIQVGSDTVKDVRDNGLDLEADVLSRAGHFFLNEQLVVVDGHVVFKPGLTTFHQESD